MRVHYVKAARKDYSGTFIKKGDSYYWWKHAYSPRRVSRTRPKPSELASSDKVCRVLEASEIIQEAFEKLSNWEDVEGLASQIEDAANTVREVGEEYEESAESMESGFGHETSTSEEVRERGGEVTQYADDLDNMKDSVESVTREEVDPDEFPLSDYDEDEGERQTAEDEAQEVLNETFLDEVRDLADDAMCPL